MSANGPILAIDFGLRRCGLSRSDPDRMVAFGLPTLDTKLGKSLETRIRELHREDPLSGVVLGFPRHLDGRPGESAGRIIGLAEWIRSELEIPVAFWDERLTTMAVERHLIEAPKRVRENKAIKDRLAAQLILQGFLDAGCPFAAASEPPGS